jgi:hypothetical protein
MTLCGFAHLQPLPGHLAGRTLALRLDGFPRQCPLQAKCAPWTVRRDILGLQLEQEQIGHNRHRHRALHRA